MNPFAHLAEGNAGLVACRIAVERGRAVWVGGEAIDHIAGEIEAGRNIPDEGLPLPAIVVQRDVERIHDRSSLCLTQAAVLSSAPILVRAPLSIPLFAPSCSRHYSNRNPRKLPWPTRLF